MLGYCFWSDGVSTAAGGAGEGRTAAQPSRPQQQQPLKRRNSELDQARDTDRQGFFFVLFYFAGNRTLFDLHDRYFSFLFFACSVGTLNVSNNRSCLFLAAIETHRDRTEVPHPLFLCPNFFFQVAME